MLALRVVAITTIALGLAEPAAALVCPGPDVRVTRSGPVPASLVVRVGDNVNWWAEAPFPSFRIDFPDHACDPQFTGITTGIEITGCWFASPGMFSYSVAGFGGGGGAIQVLPPPLQVVPDPVVFGESTVLSGEVPTALDCFFGPFPPPPPPPDQEAVVLAKAYGDSEFSPLTTVTAVGARGDFALLVSPTISTSYQARLGTVGTVTARVRVRPRIELSRFGRGRFVVRALAARSLAGSHVQLQIRRGRSSWRWVKALKLGPHAAARFRWNEHARIRVFMSAREAGPGYVAGFSPALSL
jgi:hypothetical protein